ncbi:death domain-containing protein 1 [Phyllopteryx taeniolatus]|uniref:death domain-containing protein 1 n=1 Tax=Phyllopteryx taeniolatus TaxID=161469 RepID=UPI002AD22725|nr:death domain-containing protein 1 [Phyllopteryx taeniolatus]XP_061618923.1 death domain-containing protein 1 [Phyllopteryx taeniolatus]
MNPTPSWWPPCPSRELSCELSRLQVGGNCGPLETSPEMCLREGDQLLLQLCGNVSCAGAETNEHGILEERITFRSQNELLLHLAEVDPFGNYSSPHYKGAVVSSRVSRGQLESHGDTLVQAEIKHLGKPVCTLPLTLRKSVRTVRRPVTPKITLYSLPDSLLLWLSGELSEEEIAFSTPLPQRRPAGEAPGRGQSARPSLLHLDHVEEGVAHLPAPSQGLPVGTKLGQDLPTGSGQRTAATAGGRKKIKDFK